MHILVVEDDAVTRRMLTAVLAASGHTVTEAEDGNEAWGAWQLSAPRVVLSDWIMPNLDGLELCRRIRATNAPSYTYFILQTVRSGKASFLEAMDAGIDDFITKPVVPEELKARLRAAARILDLRQELWALEGLLAVCSLCKRIREADGRWDSLERYVEARSKAEFSHGFCPECYESRVRPQLGG
ncbi:MAG TPA: response regulator transcription factor [Thermoanaerobaculia bacterium]|nr:response regulator transcription factor [Thermoanaerobaculia bacterium]